LFAAESRRIVSALKAVSCHQHLAGVRHKAVGGDQLSLLLLADEHLVVAE
jgi:hypothetical protein